MSMNSIITIMTTLGMTITTTMLQKAPATPKDTNMARGH